MIVMDKVFSNDVEYMLREGAEQMKAGKYKVIDPCYFLGHDEGFWSEFCSFCFKNGPKPIDPVTVVIGDHKVLIWSTAHGDGEYPTIQGSSVVGRSGVDAGVLSLIPVELSEVLDYLLPFDDENAPTVNLSHDFTPHVEYGDCSYGDYETLTGDEKQECSQCGEVTENVDWDGLCSYCEEQKHTCNYCGKWDDDLNDGICSSCAEEDEEEE